LKIGQAFIPLIDCLTAEINDGKEVLDEPGLGHHLKKGRRGIGKPEGEELEEGRRGQVLDGFGQFEYAVQQIDWIRLW
jgi:hypothetical protein